MATCAQGLRKGGIPDGGTCRAWRPFWRLAGRVSGARLTVPSWSCLYLSYWRHSNVVCVLALGCMAHFGVFEDIVWRNRFGAFSAYSSSTWSGEAAGSLRLLPVIAGL